MSALPVDIYFTVEELERITRRKKASAMCRRLEDMKIPHMPDGDGWPLVLRSAVEPKLTGTDTRRQDAVVSASTPDFKAAFGGKRATT